MAGAKENVVIQAGNCSVTLMPGLGGKISSLRVGAEELLQTPLHPFGPRTHDMSFAEGDASGWDECLPSVAGCTVPTEAGTVSIPDHGDLWRVPWSVLEATGDSATLHVKCFSLPLELTRSVILASTATGWRLRLLYSLVNVGEIRVPWSWSAHPLFAVEAGDRVKLPETVQTVRVEGSRCDRLGAGGDSICWPMAKSSDGSDVDLRRVQSPESGIGDKLFAGPFESPASSDFASSALSGWAVLERPRAGLRLTVRFEPSLTPYLGLWLCYGGWPDAPGAKQVCIALEPSTAPVDSLEKTGPWSRWLNPGETFTWPMELEIDSIAP